MGSFRDGPQSQTYNSPLTALERSQPHEVCSNSTKNEYVCYEVLLRGFNWSYGLVFHRDGNADHEGDGTSSKLWSRC